MINNLTRIKTMNVKNHIKYYVRFSRPVFIKELAGGQAYEYYKPSQLVGYVQWQAGEYGSRIWRFTIFKTVSPKGERKIQSINGIRPGVQILLDLEGAMRVRPALKTIDQIEAIGLQPADISSAYYGHLHQRIMAKQPAHPYGEEQHQSFLKEQGLTSWG
ncbi:MAG: DUF2840 domain-containing protein [Emcibacter sp.]|nr:DUF2840 domain-containing protein [Emcibacter sp.]